MEEDNCNQFINFNIHYIVFLIYYTFYSQEITKEEHFMIIKIKWWNMQELSYKYDYRKIIYAFKQWSDIFELYEEKNSAIIRIQ